MLFRKEVRSPKWQQDFLARPLAERQAIATALRTQSEARKQTGIAYADVLRTAGVAVDIEIYRGVTHEFIKMGRTIPQAKLAHQQAAAALRHALHSTS